MARLANWTIHTYQDASGKFNQYLTDNVFGHPKADWVRKDLDDGHKVRISQIISLDLDKNIAITQSGTVYELGSKC